MLLVKTFTQIAPSI